MADFEKRTDMPRRRFSMNNRLFMAVLDALREYEIDEVRLIAARFREKLASERIARSTRRKPEDVTEPTPPKRKRPHTTVKSRAAYLAKTRPPIEVKQTAKKAKPKKPPPAPPVVTAAKPKKRSKSTRIRRVTIAITPVRRIVARNTR